VDGITPFGMFRQSLLGTEAAQVRACGQLGRNSLISTGGKGRQAAATVHPDQPVMLSYSSDQQHTYATSCQRVAALKADTRSNRSTMIATPSPMTF
jgi:hypothetical protein